MMTRVLRTSVICASLAVVAALLAACGDAADDTARSACSTSPTKVSSESKPARGVGVALALVLASLRRLGSTSWVGVLGLGEALDFESRWTRPPTPIAVAASRPSAAISRTR